MRRAAALPAPGVSAGAGCRGSPHRRGAPPPKGGQWRLLQRRRAQPLLFAERRGAAGRREGAQGADRVDVRARYASGERGILRAAAAAVDGGHRRRHERHRLVAAHATGRSALATLVHLRRRGAASVCHPTAQPAAARAAVPQADLALATLARSRPAAALRRPPSVLALAAADAAARPDGDHRSAVSHGAALPYAAHRRCGDRRDACVGAALRCQRARHRGRPPCWRRRI